MATFTDEELNTFLDEIGVDLKEEALEPKRILPPPSVTQEKSPIFRWLIGVGISTFILGLGIGLLIATPTKSDSHIDLLREEIVDMRVRLDILESAPEDINPMIFDEEVIEPLLAPSETSSFASKIN